MQDVNLVLGMSIMVILRHDWQFVQKGQSLFLYEKKLRVSHALVFNVRLYINIF